MNPNSGGYDKFRNNPVVLLGLLNKYVTVNLIKTLKYTGFVQSIDPISHSVIISIPEGESFKTMLIPGHAVMNIVEIELLENIKPPIRTLNESNCENIAERKQSVMKWLKINLLPVSEDGEKIVFGNASLIPPYTAMDICTDNPLVALQVKKMIENMPQNIK